MALGNESADHLGMPIFKPVEEHNALHMNVHCLNVKYHIPLSQVRQIVHSCSACVPLHCKSHVTGVNPCGPKTNDI